ncbi:hypothetical protein Scep_016068 [Stephania cephalantha]|uniref:Uncharacterized protein n=1 Tax=Stephania cephalantha TaxID=152367 RepID=A0AAP0IMR6_9MAGN
MSIPQEIDVFIKESIDHSIGLPVTTETLELKLRAAEESQRRLQDQIFVLHARLKEKDEAIERARSEASLNAQALKKFVEENQRLALECSDLLERCSRLERECSLYDHDREALMEFANEADERAREAENRVVVVEEELRRVAGELESRGNEHERGSVDGTKANDELCRSREKISDLDRFTGRAEGCDGTPVSCGRHSSSKGYNKNLQPVSMNEDSIKGSMTAEGHLLESLITSMIGIADLAENAHSFLEANIGIEACQKLLAMWQRLGSTALHIIALAAEVKTLQNDKEHLRVNLTRAEEEVKVLFEENNILEEEYKRLLRKYTNREKQHGSSGKHSSSASGKGNKRKSSPKMCSSVEGMMIDFDASESPRQPLSPLQYNSPENRMHKK